MKGKAILFVSLSAMAAMAGMSTAQTAAANNDTTNVAQSKGQQQDTPTPENGNNLKQEQSYKFEPRPNFNFTPFKNTFPPKEYGMYLQRSGKQKWTKKRK